MSVRVGACSLPIQLKPGLATITEVANSGAQLVDIETTPEDRQRSKDLMGPQCDGGDRRGWPVRPDDGHVHQQEGPSATDDRSGQDLQARGRGVEQGTPFPFTVGGQTLVVQAGECSSKQTVPFGRLTVTEKAAP